MMLSNVQQLGAVPFPAFTGERVYMREFTKASGLPRDLAHWQDTVNAMLDGVDASGSIFLMVDQAPVKAVTPHRRPGLHVDGCWMPTLQAHGSHHHKAHVLGSWKQPYPGRWVANGPDKSDLLILASNVLGCAAYVGQADGAPGAGGDCSHIEASGLLRVELAPGLAWAGMSDSMLHESVPVARDCLRTVVRLNVKN